MLVTRRTVLDFGFRISDYTPPADCDSSIRKKFTRWGGQSAIRNRCARSSRLTPRTSSGPRSCRGISLTEVLISMGILTLGLLGVAAVFPVGGWYMQKADIADRGSAIAQSVMNDLVARGMLSPWAWYVATPDSASGSSTPTSPNYRYPTVDGKYCPPPGVPPMSKSGISGNFSRPFGETLREALRKHGSDPQVLAKQFGHAYVIDPLQVAMAAKNSNVTVNLVSYAFPATAYSLYPRGTSGSYYNTPGWVPWSASQNRERTWPIRRVSYQQTDGWAMNTVLAESYCMANDDLTYDFPNRDDRPSVQNWETVNVGGTQTPLTRQWTGDYSWIASVVPSSNAARDAMASNPEGFAYDVSVVVFYKRPLPKTQYPSVSSQSLTEIGGGERAVSAQVLSTSPNGGELLLRHIVNNSNYSLDDISTSPFDNLKVGQWLMLCGPHPNSSLAEPRFVMKWYQVLSVDKEGSGVTGFNPITQRVVAVRGPEWPWQPRASYPSGQQNSDVARLSDDLCVGIFRGAVAVHTKTLRLESPLGGAYGSGMSVMTPPGVTNQYIGY